MIREQRITSIEELTELLTEQEYRADIRRNRSEFVYRGMPNASFRLETSLRRNCKELQAKLEPAILKNFAKYAVMEDPKVYDNVWRQMILGQHHGLPTRLLDWTQSALVALHFAVTEDNLEKMDKRDSLVWRIDVKELHSHLPEKYRLVADKYEADIFSVDMLREICETVAEYDRDMGNSAMLVLEPPSISARIVNQYSFFSVTPMGMENMEAFLDENTGNTVKFIIDKSLRWRIRDMLDTLNMSERIVYPGLDGLSKWIARHYFVKDE